MIDLKRAYEFVAADRACPYLPNRVSKTQYLVIDNCNVDEYQRLLDHGYRRFGRLFFNPICDGCYECLSMRIDVENFQLSRSFKRVIKTNKNTKVIIRKPSMTKQHLDLHQRYHDDMDDRRNWNSEKTSSDHYYGSFVEGAGEFGYELLYFDGLKLIGVALVDILPEAISAVYCFYDPEYRDLSIGTFSILKQIEIAKRKGIKYVYLGYWVKENASLKYKERFKPFEILSGRPDLKTPAHWIPYE